MLLCSPSCACFIDTYHTGTYNIGTYDTGTHILFILILSCAFVFPVKAVFPDDFVFFWYLL